MPKIKLPASGPRTVALAVLAAGAVSAATPAPAAASAAHHAPASNSLELLH